MSQRTGWGATVGTAIAMQWSVILVLAGAAWLLSGESAARSLLGGGMAVALPNTVLALWLTLRVQRAGGAGATAMMTGEILKLAVTIAAIALVVVQLKPGLSWLAMLVGVVAALKAQWLALWVTRRF